MDRLAVFALGLLGGFWKRPPILVVLVFNLIPAACVLWLGWSALTLLVLYWVENVVVGVVTALKLRAIERKGGARPGPAATTGFFAMHYGIFTLVHGVFAFVIGGVVGNPDPAATFAQFWSERWSFLATVLALSALHAAALIDWMRSKGWETADLNSQMMAPYGRIFVMHLTVIGGAFVIIETGAPAYAIVLLALLKTVFETGWAAMSDRQKPAAAA